jgi:hypothetical protein
MGIGQFGAGLGGAGQDPVYLPSPPAPVLPPRAVKFDPSVKQFLLFDENGNAIDVHPVDQIVALRLTTEQGQSASSPGLGQRYRVLFNAAQPVRHQDIALKETKRVLQDLIDAGDIKLLSVVLTTDPVNNAKVVIPSYVNLRSPKTDPRYPLANAVQAPPVKV